MNTAQLAGTLGDSEYEIWIVGQVLQVTTSHSPAL